ncbi:Rid family detoxifying hydrolase [Vibrio nigripulchritudo]|uniref:Rid family detoxifying hydrolase n=1 Tax=Vibrio nigripulchritudo TaxID=28173 RepID=UPI0005FA4B52|nr:Rid family detoxifying hydrolase [Vibrio nigripulchritudo]KJY72494.1 endoribonuclease L-PSP [Vibrio nigripulchritudo]
MKTLNTPLAPQAIGPYVQGKDIGNLVFTSGQLPVHPENSTIPDSPEAQATQSLRNALAILESAGLGAKDVIKTTVFVQDLDDFGVINAAYKVFFDAHDASYPARSCVQVARLPLDVKVEIEMIAARN